MQEKGIITRIGEKRMGNGWFYRKVKTMRIN